MKQPDFHDFKGFLFGSLPNSLVFLLILDCLKLLNTSSFRKKAPLFFLYSDFYRKQPIFFDFF